ncbi:MAG: AAA family ATPase [Anaerolineales bacterium]|nr:AAA family ATPase [Anaerolineales bacterium]
MKLKTVHVQEFQSVRDSNEFEIGDITCLVGKNEAGKTAILQALYRLSPIIENEGNFDVTNDYPRSDVEDYQQDVETGKRKPATVISVKFDLADDEISEIESDLGKGVLADRMLVLNKNYENKQTINLKANEEVAIKFLIEKSELPDRLLEKFLKVSNLTALREEIKANVNDENTDHLKRLEDNIKDIGVKSLAQYIFIKYLANYVPKFLYFDEYYQMKGHENLETLIARSKQGKLEKHDHPLLGLLEIARIDFEELLNPARTQDLVNKLEGASNHLSKKILKYWSQNKHIELRFDVRPARPGDPEGMRQGNNLWASVYDSKHKVSTLLGTRSRGFVWFFSFLAWFDKQQKEEQPLILLLDEPGLFLHGKAQEDLLRYMEKELNGVHQVVYTTHSPFMVDSKRFDRVRIVQDREMDTLDELPEKERGTKVITDVLEATDDSLFPLQGALGYEIYQTLFVGPFSLVVEGVSDLLMLQTISGVLEKQGRTGLSQKWTITPVGGADKVPTYVSMLSSQKGMLIATLIDIQTKDRQQVENLYKKKLLKKQNVLTYADFLKRDEADLEDVFGDDFYCQLVNMEYKLELKPKDLPGSNPRILVRMEEHFKNQPIKEKASFNHYRPARYFAENINNIEKNIPSKTLDIFEKIFKALNKLIEG